MLVEYWQGLSLREQRLLKGALVMVPLLLVAVLMRTGLSSGTASPDAGSSERVEVEWLNQQLSQLNVNAGRPAFMASALTLQAQLTAALNQARLPITALSRNGRGWQINLANLSEPQVWQFMDLVSYSRARMLTLDIQQRGSGQLSLSLQLESLDD